MFWTILLRHIQELCHDDEGATSIEYGLIAVFVSLAILGSLLLIGTSLPALYTNLSDVLASLAAQL